jgi:hypothetical protein
MIIDMKSTYSLFIAASLAAVLAVSMIVAPAAFAASGRIHDKKGDTTDPNFDIRQGAFDKDGNAFIRVQGTAGGTPSGTGCNPAYAYVFAFANGDHFAVASHDCFSDSSEGNGGSDWHAHEITVSTNTGSTGHFACLTGANDNGDASVDGHRVTLLNSGESELDHVATVTIVGGAPDGDCPGILGGGTVALYVDVLDIATVS